MYTLNQVTRKLTCWGINFKAVEEGYTKLLSCANAPASEGEKDTYIRTNFATDSVGSGKRYTSVTFRRVCHSGFPTQLDSQQSLSARQVNIFLGQFWIQLFEFSIMTSEVDPKYADCRPYIRATLPMPIYRPPEAPVNLGQFGWTADYRVCPCIANPKVKS